MNQPRFLDQTKRIGTGLSFIIFPLVFVFAFSNLLGILAFKNVFDILIFLQEMVMAVWLIVKGFNSSAIDSGTSNQEKWQPIAT